MQVRVLRRFFDRQADMKLRSPDEIFEEDDKRCTELIALNLVEEVPEKKRIKKETAE